MGKGSKGTAPITRAEHRKLMDEWDFTPMSTNGPHERYVAPNGKGSVPIGRGTGQASMHELRSSARMLGLNVHSFLAGPPKIKVPALTYADVVHTPSLSMTDDARSALDAVVALAKIEETAAMRAVDRCRVEPNKEEEPVAKIIETKPRPYRRNVKELVAEFMAANPGRVVTLAELNEATDTPKTSGAVHMALQALAVTDTRYQKVGSGKWTFDAPTVTTNGKAHRVSTMPKVVEWMNHHPNVMFSAQTIADQTGLHPASINHALVTMSKRMEEMERVSRGVYIYRPASSSTSDETPVVSAPPAIDLTETEVVPAPAPERAAQVSATTIQWPSHLVPTAAHVDPGNRLWEQVADLGDSRYLLKDDSGNIWIARMSEVTI